MKIENKSKEAVNLRHFCNGLVLFCDPFEKSLFSLFGIFKLLFYIIVTGTVRKLFISCKSLWSMRKYHLVAFVIARLI